MPHVLELHDFSDPALDVYARATENQLVNRADPSNALFIAESPLVIGRALDAGCVPVSFLMETQHVAGKGASLLERCDPHIPVYTASLDVLTREARRYRGSLPAAVSSTASMPRPAAQRKIAPRLVGFITFSSTAMRRALAQTASAVGRGGRRMAQRMPRVRWKPVSRVSTSREAV